MHKSKGKAKEESLHDMPVEIQEAVILEDLLYVLMVRLARLDRQSSCLISCI